MAFPVEKASSLGPSLWLRLLLKLRPSPVAYRPERHYMRGPGPKYRERHAGAHFDSAALRRSERTGTLK
jgi:hypothetical protein